MRRALQDGQMPRPLQENGISRSWPQSSQRALAKLEALPGVESVGFITTLPLDEGAGSVAVTSRQIEASGAEPPRLRNAAAGGAYFQTMGIELLQGRFFERVEEQQGIPNVDHRPVRGRAAVPR
jgi:hypothetical protein